MIPAHLYGKPTPLESLRRIENRRGFEIVEDAAQAHGARIQGRAAGTLGTIGCFSFHPSKNLAAAGDGGAVVTNSEPLARDVRRRELARKARQSRSAGHQQQARCDAGAHSELEDASPGKLEQQPTSTRDFIARAVVRPATHSRPPARTRRYHLFQVRLTVIR